eukprot:CAMPEP_0183755934 /NCGR_PEP_ID=MMETSP0739-20130205/4635_1 /TAXON_ID=385413 /ORGANISM="Thalassiosira miniscula, Strain CCMP1093" /LENGTH=136 /DNA_ID=CAMNT_0025992971 /DNA_START=6 /DNA_END=413 /DNA_ORIENTATION=-
MTHKNNIITLALGALLVFGGSTVGQAGTKVVAGTLPAVGNPPALKDTAGCVAWDTVYTTAGAALSDWAMFGTDNFCGEPVILNRTEGKSRLSFSSRPSFSQCKSKTPLSSSHRAKLVEYTGYDAWKMRRRGYTNLW